MIGASRTDFGDLKRSLNILNVAPVRASKNYGFDKSRAMEQQRFIYDKTCCICGGKYQAIVNLNIVLILAVRKLNGLETNLIGK